MKLNKNLAMILLAVFLILAGLTGLGVSFGGLLRVAEALCALGAGILLLINR